MEAVGEFLGLEEDKAIDDDFRRYRTDLFPDMGHVHPTTFVCRAANPDPARPAHHARRQLSGADLLLRRCSPPCSAWPTHFATRPEWIKSSSADTLPAPDPLIKRRVRVTQE
jgi:hypothetical protein